MPAVCGSNGSTPCFRTSRLAFLSTSASAQSTASWTRGGKNPCGTGEWEEPEAWRSRSSIDRAYCGSSGPAEGGWGDELRGERKEGSSSPSNRSRQETHPPSWRGGEDRHSARRFRACDRSRG